MCLFALRVQCAGRRGGGVGLCALTHTDTNAKKLTKNQYKVDDSGKVQRLRKQCPQCGPGIFMATHFDRVYCGKCATTYLVEQAPAKGGKGKK